MLELIISILFLCILLIPVMNQYAIVQSCHYEISRYFKYEKNKKILVSVINVSMFLISFFLSDINKIVFMALNVLAVVLLFYKKEKVKFTKRIKRFFIVYFIVGIVSFVIVKQRFFLVRLISAFFIFYLAFIHFVSCLLEKTIMHFYVKEARNIIDKVKVIGVTGSYGKTSCKNIIYDMLKGDFNVSKTPKSFNTKVGIVKSIRENVNKEDDYFVCEYGVDRKGGMDKLLKIVKPNIALITEIGPQHLLTFKNIENIKNEKMKLARCLKGDEWVVINNDNEYLREGITLLKCNVLTYGIKNDSDIMAKNIKMNNNGSSFDLYVKGEKYTKVNSVLLGEHNVLNILGGIGVLYAAGIDLKRIDYRVSCVKPVNHRLELKHMQDIKVIDDSFNSNVVGFKKAIDVLSLMKEEKYVITPGVIEQGLDSCKVNYELGKYMANKIDFAILVEENANVIKQGLIDGGFNKDKVIVKSCFIDAWSFVKEISDDNKIFLIENDLPSIYLK